MVVVVRGQKQHFPATPLPRFVAGKAEPMSRKGFFSGVATVCTKLFNIVQPAVVVFGKKDRLQCFVILKVLSIVRVVGLVRP